MSRTKNLQRCIAYLSIKPYIECLWYQVEQQYTTRYQWTEGPAVKLTWYLVETDKNPTPQRCLQKQSP